MAKAFRELIGISPSTASTADSVLIIIDAQNEYAEGQLQTHNVSSTRATIASLLDKYREASAPIVHIHHRVPAGAPVFTPDTPLCEPFAELEPRAGEKVIPKQFPGSFTGTGLEEFLTATGRTKVVLTGYMAHVCVSTTARQAAEKGFDVCVVEDAVGDRDIPGVSAQLLVEVTLKELGDAFGTVVKAGDIR
ncbi:isochorismatase [Coleophoma cylindrospora]|uniref:Isochorismatase n=1 Tax=Coleophoma cylindrospora TaxID=1849047 RepID=A0A3D8QLD8_9HELO|nr:isochorismatase [Coleophoma cylindrospora]